MKKLLLALILCLTITYVRSQSEGERTGALMKGDFLINVDVQAVKLNKPAEDTLKWEGMPARLGIEYFLYNKRNIALSTGLNAIYLRHQPGLGMNYGVLGVAVPFNVHFIFSRKLDAWIGYKAGYYFDSYEPVNETVPQGYEGFYSDGYVGARFFITPCFAIYSEISADAMRLFGGISIRL